MADAVDVVIAGGGPAGATLAVALGRAGLLVELYDARRFPREKPCGEAIMPAGVAVLERLGLLEAVGGHRLAAVRYHGFGVSAESPFAPPGRPGVVALAQRRLRLDEVLWRAARATPGVRVFEDAPVEGVELLGGRAIGLRVGGTLRRGGLVVGADGLDSPVRRALGLTIAAPPSARDGVRMHFRLAAGRALPDGDRLEIFLGRDHELYAAPLPDGEVLLAGLTDHGALAGGARAALDGWIAEQPILRAALEGATPLTAPAGRISLSRRARAGFAPGAVLLGDAARASDPLTAGGVAHALVTAERLAAAVPAYFAEGDAALARFDRERRRLLRGHHLLTRALVFVVRRPRLAAIVLRGMRATPAVMRHLVGVAAGAGIRPPDPHPTKKIAAKSSAPAEPMSNATAQNAKLPHRARSA